MKKNRILTLAIAGVLSGTLGHPAFAHESRGVAANETGKWFRVTVGYAIEPAFEDADNQGIDVFINAWDGYDSKVNDLITASVNRNAKPTGDMVKLKVTALYLDKDASLPIGPNPGGKAKIIASKVIADDFDSDPNNNTVLPYGETNVYRTYHRTTHPGAPEAGRGAYGYLIQGDIAFLGGPADPVCTNEDCSTTITPDVAARTAHIDEYFICGGGHGTAPDPFTGKPNTGKYNCVQVLPTFPGKREDGYQANKALGSR
jgi:hypothetical protein